MNKIKSTKIGWAATTEDDIEGIHVVDLFPIVPKRELNAAFTETVVNIASKDPQISLLAQELSDEVDGIGMISALKVLAGCGMLLNRIEDK